MIKASVYDTISQVWVIVNGDFPSDWDDALIKTAVSIDRWGSAKSAFAYRVERNA
jgi:hypothetical protein